MAASVVREKCIEVEMALKKSESFIF
jgi:hypothetical protein